MEKFARQQRETRKQEMRTRKEFRYEKTFGSALKFPTCARAERDFASDCNLFRHVPRPLAANIFLRRTRLPRHSAQTRCYYVRPIHASFDTFPLFRSLFFPQLSGVAHSARCMDINDFGLPAFAFMFPPATRFTCFVYDIYSPFARTHASPASLSPGPTFCAFISSSGAARARLVK